MCIIKTLLLLLQKEKKKGSKYVEFQVAASWLHDVERASTAGTWQQSSCTEQRDTIRRSNWNTPNTTFFFFFFFSSISFFYLFYFILFLLGLVCLVWIIGKWNSANNIWSNHCLTASTIHSLLGFPFSKTFFLKQNPLFFFLSFSHFFLIIIKLAIHFIKSFSFPHKRKKQEKYNKLGKIEENYFWTK